jgi:hypothetical protein
MTTTIPEDVLAKLPEGFRIAHGSHDSFSKGTCALELVDYLDRSRRGSVDLTEKPTDMPQCVCPAIRRFVIRWNDSMGVSAKGDETRRRLIGPLIGLMLDTRTTTEDMRTRAWLATDWAVRVNAPLWFDLVGLTEHAEALRKCAPLTKPESAAAARPVLANARAAAWKKRSAAAAAAAAADAYAADAAAAAAYAAAYAAAAAAAAAYAYAYAADAAAYAYAADAAAAAAYAAADAAYGASFKARILETVEKSQASGQDLVRAMCAVGREATA